MFDGSVKNLNFKLMYVRSSPSMRFFSEKFFYHHKRVSKIKEKGKGIETKGIRIIFRKVIEDSLCSKLATIF